MSLFRYIQMKLQELRRPIPRLDFHEEELQKLGWFTEQEIEDSDVYNSYSAAPSMQIRIVDDREESIKQGTQAQEIVYPEEKITLENMSPETKQLLYEFMMYPTSDYMGLGNLLATYNTEAKLRTYLSSRVGLKRAKRKSFYD